MAEFCRRTGQAVPAGRGACVRAVYESLALQYRRVHEQISGVCGGPCRVAHVVGGGSRNRLLNQFAANALGLPLLAGPEEATAAGNFIVQALGLGAIGSLREGQTLVRCAFPPQEYRPEGRPAWEQAYARFLELPCS
jgi:sugar (pentulose or hexulose) kinase